MTTPLPYFWNRSVDFYREVRRMPELVNAAVEAGNLSIEFNECRDAIVTLNDELPSLMTFITKPQYSRLKELVHEAADRYNSYLAALRDGAAQRLSLEEFNEFHSHLVKRAENVFLDHVAGLVIPRIDESPEYDLLDSTQQLFELKPNIAGIGLNLNALITWLRARRGQ